MNHYEITIYDEYDESDHKYSYVGYKDVYYADTLDELCTLIKYDIRKLKGKKEK